MKMITIKYNNNNYFSLNTPITKLKAKHSNLTKVSCFLHEVCKETYFVELNLY